MHLLVISDGDSKYGSANSLYGLIRELKNYDPEMIISIVVTMKSEKLDDYLKLGCNAFKVPYDFYYRTLSYEKWKRPLSLVRHFPDYLYGRILGYRSLSSQIDLKSVDIIHSNTFREDLSWEIKKRYQIPIVRHIREFGDLDYKGFSYRKKYIDKLNKNTDSYIAISDIIKKHWVKKGLDPEKIIRIYNGVDRVELPKIVYPQKEDIIKFVIVGALLETKGQHLAIEALSRLPDDVKREVHLDIIGDCNNTYASRLAQLVEDYHLNKIVSFKGYLKNPIPQLRLYDCGLMCSKSEGFGRVTAEYMMSGLCVIASNSGANAELIKDDYSGLFFEEGNADDLAEKITKIIRDKSRIKTFGTNARRCAEDLFTTDKNAINIYKLYCKLLQKDTRDGN